MKTAVIYARYSSERQSEQSIEGQIRVCTDYAERNDIVIVDTYIDRAMTGTNDKRTDFQRMLKDSVKKAWDFVLVYKLDRFGRNKYEAAINKHTLKTNGVKLISAMENIPDTPEGIILESLLEGMAEYYSAELSQKVKRGLKESRLKGQFTGGSVPYGYRVENKKVYINDDEAKIVNYIFSQYAKGIFVKDIIKDLNDKGLTHRHYPFSITTVYGILKNERYSGITRFKDQVYDNIFPRIIPKEIYEMVRKKSEENHFGKHDSTACYILKNKIKCGLCGSLISSDTGTARDGTIKRYYKCLGRKKTHSCNKTIIRKELLEEMVIETTIKVFGSDQTLSDIADKILISQEKQLKDQSVINILTEEINDIQKSINNLLAAMEKGIITKMTKSRMEELEQQLELKQEKLLIEKSQEKVKITKTEIIRYLKDALKEHPKTMISLLIKEIILYEDKMEIYYNYTNRKKTDDNDHQAFLFYTENFSKQYFYSKFDLHGTDTIDCPVNIKIKIQLLT